ncbi:hypothetical protein JHK82_054787 [Glycine max]|nr:hypothetical protein JHK82_054787 [Glycine max]
MHNFTKHHPSATKLKSGVSQVIEIGYEGEFICSESQRLFKLKGLSNLNLNSSNHAFNSRRTNFVETSGTIARLVQTSDLGPGGVGCLSSFRYDLLSAFKNESFQLRGSLARSVSVKSDKVYNGFVKDVATFIVTDDLVVIPNAMDSSFGVLQKFGVKSWSSIQEMTVNVTKKKVIFGLHFCIDG